jgi:hypothetical protein
MRDASRISRATICGQVSRVVARLERDDLSSIPYMELLSTNGVSALEDDAAATLVRWTNLSLNCFPFEGLAAQASAWTLEH